MKGTIYLPYNESATLEGGRVPAEMSLVVQTALDESQLQTASGGDGAPRCWRSW